MRKGTLHVAVAATLLGLGATPVKAETPVVGPSSNTVELRVVNRGSQLVRVFVQDAAGRVHQLGRVAGDDFGILQIPGQIAAMGEMQIQVFPSEPVGSLMGAPDGIHTKGMKLKLGDAVNLFIEPQLDHSLVELQRG